MFKMYFFLALLITSMLNPAQAQVKLCAGADDKSVYTQMANDMKRFCGQDLAVTYSPSSFESVGALNAKTCTFAVVQGNVLTSYAAVDANTVAGISNIAGLHTEDYHFVSVSQTGGVLGIGAKKIASTNDLGGIKLGMTKSGAISWKDFARLTGITGVEVVLYDSIPNVIKGMSEKQVQGALFVTGKGNDAMKALPSQFGFVPVSAEHIAKLKAGGYADATLTYGAPIKTIATRAHLVVRRLSDHTRSKELSACLISKLGQIQDDDKTSQNWSGAYLGGQLVGIPALK